MTLFGKRKVNPEKLFSEVPMLLTRQSIEEEWWPLVEIEERAIECKPQVIRELLLLHLFAIDLAIFSAFQGEVQGAMRDQIHIHAAETPTTTTNHLQLKISQITILP